MTPKVFERISDVRHELSESVLEGMKVLFPSTDEFSYHLPLPTERGEMLEKVLKLLRKSRGRAADGFQCLLVTGGSNTPSGTDVVEAKDEDIQLSGSDGEVERQLEFDVSRPSDPEDEEIMVSYKRACDAHVKEEQDWQKIASLRLKVI
ncbi:hypothetical protein Dimus_022194 [Dionaea muscipula]